MLAQAERVAMGFARRTFRHGLAFEEAKAEAAFIVVEMIWTNLQSIKERWPNREERLTFYRMSVGYRLKAYFALRPTSTESFLRKKGIEVRDQPSLQESQAVQYSSEVDDFIALEHAVRDELELRVVELHAMGNARDLISSKLSISEKRVKKILTRIRKRLKNST